MSSGLVAELGHKLDELDRKVLHYQQQSLADFHEFYYNRIRDCDASTVAAINSALLPTLSDYHNLRPSLPDRESRETPPSDPAPASAAEATFQPLSPAAAIITTSESQPKPSHDRETELQGIFVPTYLPLLEAAPRPAPSPRSPPSPGARQTLDSTLAVAALLDDKANDRQSSLSTAHPEPSGSPSPSKMDQPDASETDSQHSDLTLSLRPDHQRRSTDDTTSSAVSEKSTSNRRSALRRSSSPSRMPQSPRRVRFEVMGAEVLPTASPRNSEMTTPRPASPSTGTQKSMLDDDDDEPPPPRKISSSEALRALSRTPMDGTVWTVVNPESDDASSEQTNSRPITPVSPAKADNKTNSEGTRSVPRSPSSPPSRTETLDASEDGVRDDIDGDDDDDEEGDEGDSSEEEFLSMGKAKSFSSKKPIHSAPLTVQVKPAPVTRNSQTSEARMDERDRHEVNGAKLNQDDETHQEDEDPFHFEMSGLSAPPKPRNQTRPATPPKSHEESDDEAEDGKTAAGSSEAMMSTSATSSALPITKHRPQAAPTTPTRVQFQVGSVGSYKGRPINMPVVRDPELMAQAESLGDFDTFVGGLDGRSGVDEGNMNSFRASFRQGSMFSGTPRSLTERFLREEMEEEQKRNGGRS